jgi:phosphoribosyl-ATP pyrophosphohydrolase
MLLQRGEVAIRNKLLEEVAELIIESRLGDRPRIAEELADVFYLTLVLASHHGVRLADVERRLAARHSKGKVASAAASSASAVLRRLAPFRARPGNFTFSRLCKTTGFEPSQGADIVLFSPFLKALNEFPRESKTLKTLLEKHGLKAKWGLRSGESARFITRRPGSLLSAIVFIAKPVVLPLTVKLLVDHLNEMTDSRESELVLRLTVAADSSAKEQSFVMQGTPERVRGELAKVLSG